MTEVRDQLNVQALSDATTARIRAIRRKLHGDTGHVAYHANRGAGTMIQIQPSKTADTRSCDYANVSRDTLLRSSVQHIGDVRRALGFFVSEIMVAADRHDFDKITEIDHFHADFVTGFAQTGWWDQHLKLNRHHLLQADGVPDDVNLIDVLDMIADCVMAGMARTGEVYPLTIPEDVLRRAFDNTVNLLKAQVVVAPPAAPVPPSPPDEIEKTIRMAVGAVAADGRASGVVASDLLSLFRAERQRAEEAEAEVRRLAIGHNEYNRVNRILTNENDSLRVELAALTARTAPEVEGVVTERSISSEYPSLGTERVVKVPDDWSGRVAVRRVEEK